LLAFLSAQNLMMARDHMPKSCDIIIIGGGLTGSIIALLLTCYRPEVEFLLIEAGESCGGDTLETAIWDEIPEIARAVIDGAIVKDWAQCHIAYPSSAEKRDTRTVMLDPTQLHLEVLRQVSSDDMSLNSVVHSIEGDTINFSGGAATAQTIIDARETETLHSLNVLIKSSNTDFETPHGLSFPVLADMSLTGDSWAFQQYFPVDPTKMLIRYVGQLAHEHAPGQRSAGAFGNADIIRLTPRAADAHPYAALPSLAWIPSRLQLATKLASCIVASTTFDRDELDEMFGRVQNESAQKIDQLFALVRDLKLLA
jgi:Lycopene cyclase protein